MSQALLTPLARARAASGMSLTQVSAAVQYDRGGLSRIERGMSRPRPALANRLVQLFEGKLTRDQILFPEEYPLDGKKPSRSTKGRA